MHRGSAVRRWGTKKKLSGVHRPLPKKWRRRRGILQIGNLRNVLRGSQPVATIWGALGSRVQLRNGLHAPSRRPTSVPTTRKCCTTVSCTEGRRYAGGELRRNYEARGRPRPRELDPGKIGRVVSSLEGRRLRRWGTQKSVGSSPLARGQTAEFGDGSTAPSTAGSGW